MLCCAVLCYAMLCYPPQRVGGLCLGKRARGIVLTNVRHPLAPIRHEHYNYRVHTYSLGQKHWILLVPPNVLNLICDWCGWFQDLVPLGHWDKATDVQKKPTAGLLFRNFFATYESYFNYKETR